MEGEFDLVVVGSGLAGLTGAIVASDLGLSVAVVERSGVVGGVAAVSLGKCWIPRSRATTVADDHDTREAVDQYLDFAGAGMADSALRKRFVDILPTAADYLAERAGVRWRLMDDADNFFPWAPGSTRGQRVCVADPIDIAELGEWQALTRTSPFRPAGEQDGNRPRRTLGEALMSYLVLAAFTTRSIPVFLNTRAHALNVHDRTVDGVVTESEGRRVLVRAARGVLLATGGDDWNETALRPEVPHILSLCPPIVTGDHLVMGAEIGAEIAQLPSVGIHTNFGYHIPGETMDGRSLFRNITVEASQPHAILVNESGRRFVDESFFVHEEAAIRKFDPKTRRFENIPAYLIFDDSAHRNLPFGPFMKGADLPNPPFARAESLEGLAATMGIDPAGLRATVGRFNGFCLAGVDVDFGRAARAWNLLPEVMGAIEKPPFHGIEVQPQSVGVSHRGLLIDEHARVQHVRGRPIPGLYAAGNAAAQTEIGPVYLSGVTNARGIAWGYAAAVHASARSESG